MAQKVFIFQNETSLSVSQPNVRQYDSRWRLTNARRYALLSDLMFLLLAILPVASEVTVILMIFDHQFNGLPGALQLQRLWPVRRTIRR